MASSQHLPNGLDTAVDQHHAPSVVPSTPTKSTNKDARLPSTPARVTFKEPAMTPRVKKKVPWKGKNITVLIPRDEERGRPGMAPKPLSATETERMFHSWEELGYSVRGFDLEDSSAAPFHPTEGYSQSRMDWPAAKDIVNERSNQHYQVTLPDLNAWRDYVNELNEAKLRALGVSFGGDEEPAPASISPAPSAPSRQASAQYPPLPFSPPMAASTASSTPAQGFPFPGQFMGARSSSAVQSPGIPSVASPGPFSKFNPRQSISIPMGHSPFQPGHQASPSLGGWPMPQGLGRTDSPSLLNGIVSPMSPFMPEGFQSPGSPAFNLHQRHQSLQYPILPHQQLVQQQSARASPRLQEVQEVEEEPENRSPSKTPEPETAAQKNSDDLQAEIDEAEYHLEEQMRNELEHADYSPHHEDRRPQEFAPLDANMPDEAAPPPLHSREPSMQFQEPLHFANALGDGPVLHHPRPHSRGHSLTKNFFEDEPRPSLDANNLSQLGIWNNENQTPEDAAEIETNPSNLGTPVQDFNLASILQQQHQRSFSTASNPWEDSASNMDNSHMQRRPSHDSKPSFSKLNVKAPEFKFNPTNEFKPSGQFSFGLDNIMAPAPAPQPQVFQAGVGSFMTPSLPQHSPFAFGSHMHANVPSFTPGQGDFSFSSSGPKFRPDAPAFTPFGAAPESFGSPNASGNESIASRPNSIFGNINITNVGKQPAKKSKAIPIVPPSSEDTQSYNQGPTEDADGRLIDESRAKRTKAFGQDGGDDVPRFAEPTPSPQPEAAKRTESIHQDDLAASGIRSTDEDGTADTTMSSTASEHPMDSNAVTATSPSNASQDHWQNKWQPFEFDSNLEMSSFNNARPFGDEGFKKTHRNSLSATAQAFIPGSSWASAQETESDQEEEDDREREATVEPPAYQLAKEEEQEQQQEASPVQRSPSPVQQPIEEVQVPAMPVETKPLGQTPPLRRGLGASRFASPPPTKGLGASRFASPPQESEPEPEPEPEAEAEPEEVEGELQAATPESLHEPASVEEHESRDIVEDPASPRDGDIHNATFEEIDAIMDHLNQNDPTMGVNKAPVDEPPRWHQPSPNRQISIAGVTNSPPFHLPPTTSRLGEASRSPSPRKYQQLPQLIPAMPTTELEDPFVDPPHSAQSIEPPVRHLNVGENMVNSDWDGTFSDDEQDKLEQRVQFFDGRVNGQVNDILDARLQPIEKTLVLLERHLSRRTSSMRRDRRSVSAEIQESDADDEDEEPVMRRSMSPRRDKRMEQMRAIVNDALMTHMHSTPVAAENADAQVLSAITDMKEHFGANLRLGDDLRSIVEEAIANRLPATPEPDTDDHDLEVNKKFGELQAKIADLDERLYAERDQAERERKERREAEDVAAELNRKLQAAETRVEVEIMNRSIYDQRVGDLEDRLKQQEVRTEEEVSGRRAAEDRLSEVQRLLRISSEEENRLREVLEDRDSRLKSIEQSTAKSTMRMSLLEAAQNNSTQSKTEMTNRINVLESDLRQARQEAGHYKAETERAADISKRQLADLDHARAESTQQQRFLDTLGTQLEENERMREGWRAKFISLQDEMTKAAREITEENARRTKKEQALVARQEVLDARLQAEARTRERLEQEIERLENGERQGLRAVSECKRLEGLLGEMRTENHRLEQAAARYQREFEEARESGANEVERTRRSLQFEIDQANNQVNSVRQDLEEQVSKLQGDLDQANLDIESAKAQAEMLVEDAQTSKTTEIEQLTEKHRNQLEDLHTRHAMQLGNTIDEAQKAEQLLLERLSLSSSKTEHLQDRIAHLEEKLEIAKEAALAAAKRATKSPIEPSQPSPFAAAPLASVAAPAAPEKISPQALRESIMVLQEQLQAREQRIEELEQTVEKLDPEAASKITKRDDEISWLRELLAVRHGDLQDIIRALSTDEYSKEAVKDAAIRLKANLQMEEQERERALNGGSAINLLQAATPRVAQAVGPLAAAWGNWRKSQQQSGRGSFSSLAGAMSSPSGTPSGRNNSTPSKSTSSQSPNSLLGGLLTPPASNLRQTPPTNMGGPQPTAFNTTGRRMTPQELARKARGSSMSSRQAQKQPQRDETPSPRPSSREPMTPPMMRPSAYDSDAHAGDFDDNDFFEED